MRKVHYYTTTTTTTSFIIIVTLDGGSIAVWHVDAHIQGGACDREVLALQSLDWRPVQEA